MVVIADASNWPKRFYLLLRWTKDSLVAEGAKCNEELLLKVGWHPIRSTQGIEYLRWSTMDSDNLVSEFDTNARYALAVITAGDYAHEDEHVMRPVSKRRCVIVTQIFHELDLLSLVGCEIYLE